MKKILDYVALAVICIVVFIVVSAGILAFISFLSLTWELFGWVGLSILAIVGVLVWTATRICREDFLQ